MCVITLSNSWVISDNSVTVECVGFSMDSSSIRLDKNYSLADPLKSVGNFFERPKSKMAAKF